MFGFRQIIQLLGVSYPQEDPRTSMWEPNGFSRGRHPAIIYEMMPSLWERDQREQAQENAATETLRAAHAKLVEELLAKLSELDRAVKEGALTPYYRSDRTRTAHATFDQRLREMIETAERMYGYKAVSAAKYNLNLPS